MADPGTTSADILGPPPAPPSMTSASVLGPPPDEGMTARSGVGKGVPQSVVQRFQRGDAVTRIMQKVIEGASAGASMYASTDTQWASEAKALDDAGLGINQPYTPGGMLRTFDRSLAAGAQLGGEALKQIYGGTLGAVQGAVQGTGEELGLPNAEEAGNSAAATLDAYLSTGGPGAHATRMDPKPGGGFVDTDVGPVPSEVEVGQQAQAIADYHGLPEHSAQAIANSFIHRGVLPAEIFHDAANDPKIMEDLAAGQIPRVYGGEPGPATSMPNVAPEDFARLSQEAALKERHTAIQQQLDALPQGDASAADRLNRLRAVEQQLADKDISPEAAKRLSERRDQILVDTNPEALRAAAAPLEQRRALEAQQASVQSQLDEIAKARGQMAEGTALAAVPKPGEGPSVPVSPQAEQAVEPPAKPAGETGQVPATEAPAKAPAAPQTAPVGGGKPGAAVTVVKGTGETHTPALAARLTAEDIERGLYDEAELPTRNRTVDADQRERVINLFAENPQKMIDALMGRGRMPSGVLPEFLLAGGRAYAERIGDYGLLRDLATRSRVVRESPTIAARLRAHQELGGNTTDPMALIKEVDDAKAADAAPKVAAETEKAVQQVQAIKQEARAATPDAWQKFVAEITCK